MAKILITDDSQISVRILERILKNEKYEIITAQNGTEALQKIKENDFDLILLDIVMPNMDGFTLCEKIRKNKKTAEVPVIYLTKKSDKESLLRGFEVGGQDYVTKPYEPSELLARVRTHIALKQSKDKQEHLIKELRDALSQVKHLSGLLPICSNCKKIRDDNGYWQQVEQYLSEHTDADFSHSICPDCMKDLYPKQYKALLKKGNIE